jgi:hypothetical protein
MFLCNKFQNLYEQKNKIGLLKKNPEIFDNEDGKNQFLNM